MRNRKYRMVCILFFIAMVASVTVGSTVRYVSPTGNQTGGYTSWATAAKTIQKAVDACADGDTVWVTNGMYSVSSQVAVTKSVTVSSFNGPSVTTVDGQNLTRCFLLAHTNALLKGFTIIRGNSGTEHGGGVRCDGGHLWDSLVYSNSARYGGGVYIYGGSVNNSKIQFNTASKGGGVYGNGDAPDGTIRNCLIANNVASAAGGGVKFYHGGTMENCTLVKNHSGGDGGGLYSWGDSLVLNTIIYGNTASRGRTYWHHLGEPLYSHCCLEDLPSNTEKNTTNSPMFAAFAASDYRLSFGSPCINSGSNQPWMLTALDLEGNPRIVNGMVDMGAYEYTSFMVIFDVQGGTPPSPVTKSVTYASTYGTLATTSRTGYTFGGWWTGAGGTGSEVTSATTVSITAAQTLYAKWTANSYAVTFNAQGGTNPSPLSKSVTYASTYGTLATTSRSGYTFGGWWTGAGGTGSEVTSSTTVSITAAQTLYAKWTANNYTVTFDAQSGTTPSPLSKSVTYASTYGTLAMTSRSGYTFGGWWIGAGGTGSEVTSSTTVSITAAQTLYAKWTANSYTLSFDPQGGEVNPTNKTVIFNAVYGELPDPNRAGYTFTGWETTTNDVIFGVSSNTVISIPGDHTLDATWTTNSYTVTFDAMGGVAPSPATINVTYDSAYGTLVTTSRAGYTFAGWWTEAGGTGTDITDVTVVTTASVHTLYAKWTTNQYTLTFDCMGGTAVTSITQDYGTSVTAPAAPTRTGYTFTGWNPTVPATMPVGGMTLTAQWTANSYTVTFDAQGGEVNPTNKIVTFNAAYGELPDPARTGYTFTGWQTSTNDITFGVTSNTVVSIPDDHTLDATWTTNSYTVTFDAQGGTAPIPATINFTYDAAYGTLATTSRAGYTFAGWWTGAAGTGTEVTAATVTVMADAHTLYAKWTANQYVLTFDSMGGTAIAPITQDYGTPVTAPAVPTRTGYTFTGWNPTVPATMPVGGMTLTAQWAANSYTVAFDAQGGDAPSPATKSVTYDAAYGALAMTTRIGYTFAGWWTEVGGTGTEITAETIVSTADTHTLYACWNGKLVPVHRFWSGKFRGHFYTISEGEKNNIIANLAKDWGYEGIAYYAYHVAVPSTVPVYRFWSTKYRGHFYTTSEGEKNNIIANLSKDWAFEGAAYYAYPVAVSGSTPVYRFWSSRYKHHFYTISESEKNNIIATLSKDWAYEGIAYYAFASDSTLGGRSASFSRTDNTDGIEMRAANAPAKVCRTESVADEAQISDVSRTGLVEIAIPLTIANSAIKAYIFDPITEKWTCVSGDGALQAETVFTDVQPGRDYRFEVWSEDASRDDAVPLHTSSFVWQLDPPTELNGPEILSESDSIAGVPVVRLNVPATDGALTLKLYSSTEGVLETREHVLGGGRVEFGLPTWNRWYWIGGWRDSDHALVLSLWLRHETE